jgi:iron complex transport system substrate-binding protein
MGKMPMPRCGLWFAATLVALIAVRSAATAGEPVSRIVSVGGAVRRRFTPRVMFLFGRSGGVLNVAGSQTAADAILQIVGVQNAVQDYDGYKPLTADEPP